MTSKAILLTAAALVPVAVVAHSEVYMTPEEAAHMIFPGVKLSPREIDLTADQADRIAKASDEMVRNKKLKIFEGPGKQLVFIDQVLGKHEFITYAVGVGPDAKVAGIEIIEYRETYGQQVRNEAWRKQFDGKDAADALKVGKNIKNISGATLSSTHITNGVRRLLQTYGIIKPSL